MKLEKQVRRIILSFMLIYLVLFQPIVVLAKEKWCWTKSMANEPSYVFKPEKGGINWGYCKPNNNGPKKVKYNISVLTSSLPKSETRYI